MTIDIEKQFFNTFDIEPTRELIFRTMNCACGYHDCKNCDKYKNNFQKTYPQITDRILLELICILNPYSYPSGKNIQHLKEGVLKWCIKFKNNIKQQVQELFEEKR